MAKAPEYTAWERTNELRLVFKGPNGPGAVNVLQQKWVRGELDGWGQLVISQEEEWRDVPTVSVEAASALEL